MNSKLSGVTDLVSPQSLLVGAAAVAVSAYTVRRIWKSRHLPPGPIGLPLLGRLPWIDVDHIEESAEKMRQKYGGIYSYYAGQRLMIVVSSYEMLNDMLKQDIFSGRMAPPFRTKVTKGCGLAFTEGQTWNQQRRLCLRILRNFGSGRSDLTRLIEEEVDKVLASIAAGRLGRNTARLFAAMSNNVIALMVFGRRYADEDSRYERFVNDMDQIANLGVASVLGFLFPAISPALERATAASNYLTAFQSLRKFTEQEIEERQSQLTDPDVESLCLVDAYIQERRKAEAKGDFDTYKPFQLVVTAMEMFVAGTETTASSLQWLLLHMSVYTDIQARVHNEIDTVVGQERRPQMSDKTQLHYTQAVIDESMRFASLDFNGLPHRAVKDATFRGFRIPSDAAIVPFAFGAHRDAAVWTRPNEFYPEHFLDSEGHYSPSKYLIPFLIGKRSCPGEGLAKVEIFLTFAAVMQRFSTKLQQPDQTRSKELLRGRTATLRKPGAHLVDFELRAAANSR